MADVYFLLRLMLWATVADGIATFLECFTVEDVITTVADGIATGSMYNCYFYFKFFGVVQNLIPCEAEGTCVCFYLGMNC